MSGRARASHLPASALEAGTGCGRVPQPLKAISPSPPISPHISLYLPYLPIAPYISLTWNMLSLLLELEAVDLLQ